MSTPRRSTTEPPRDRSTHLVGGSALLALLALVAVGLYLFPRSDGTTGAIASPIPAAAPDVPLGGDWAGLFGDAGRTSAVVVAGPAGQLQPRWIFDAGSPLFAPVRSGDALFVFAADGTLYALEADTGAQRWAVDLRVRFPIPIREYSAPAVLGDTIYIGTPRATIVALDVRTGEERWQFTGIGSVITGVVASEGMVVGGTSAGMVYGIDAESGEQRWSEAVGRISAAAPSASEGIVVIGTNLGVVQALEMATGRTLWRIETERGPIRTMPINAGLVYVPTGNGALLVLDLETGVESWRYDTALELAVMPPAVSRDAGMIIFTVPGDSVFALDLQRGTIEWRTAFPEREAGTVTVAGSFAYFVREGVLHVVDVRTGDEVGRYDGGAAPGTPLAAAGEVIYAVAADGRLLALGAAGIEAEEAPVNRAEAPPRPTPVVHVTATIRPGGSRPSSRPTAPADGTPISPRIE